MNAGELLGWLGESRVLDVDGKPLVVYRGEHGVNAPSSVGLRSRLGSLTFGSAATASTYAKEPNDRLHDHEAHSPVVVPAYLRIERPIVESPDDPFIDVSRLIETLGIDQARRIAFKFRDHIENTGRWQEDFADANPSVGDFIQQAGEDDLSALYFEVYPVLDDPAEVALLRAAGFDGAIHGGSGVSAMEPEYRVFDAHQVLPAIDAGWPHRPQPAQVVRDVSQAAPRPKSSVKKVRAALSRLVGEKAVRLAEGLGRLVVTTSHEIRAAGSFQISANVMASFADVAGFREMLAKQRAAKARAIDDIGPVGEGAIVRHKSLSPQWLMILRDASEPGKWRTQSFDLKGFSGHMVYADRAAAIDAAASAGYTVRDDLALDRIQDTPEFQRGLFVCDLIRSINLGQMTREEGDRQLAAYDETHRVLHSLAASTAQAFVVEGGEVMYLLADRIDEGSEEAVFLHEIMHRFGRRILGDEGFADLATRVKLWSSSPDGSVERQIHDGASARARAATGQSVVLYNEELIAYGVEEAVARGVRPLASAHPESAQAWLEQVASTLRGVIRASMGGEIDLGGAQDLVDLAYAFAQLENPERVERIMGALMPGERQVLASLIARGGAPKWYSELEMRVRLQAQAKMPPRQWIGWINAQVEKGIKPDEIYWSGVTEWLATLPEEQVVERQDVLEFIAANGVSVSEVMHASSKGVNEDNRRASKLLVELTAAGFQPDVDPLNENELIGLFRRSDRVIFYFDEQTRLFRRDDEIDEALSAEISRLGVAYGEALERKGSHDEVAGAPQYADWTLDGGDNYRELLLTLPPSPRKPRYDVISRRDKSILYKAESQEDAQAWLVRNQGLPAARGAEVLERGDGQPVEAEFFSTHWSHPNIVAHVRVTDRTNPQGQKVLFVEEIQSDWAQAGMDRGFKLTPWEKARLEPGSIEALQALANGTAGDMTVDVDDGFGAPMRQTLKPVGARPMEPAPFVTHTEKWTALAVRRLIKLAVDEGYDAVAFVTGDQSVERYGLRHQVDALTYLAPKVGRAGAIVGWKLDQVKVERAIADHAALVSFLGPDLAQRLLSSPVGDGEEGPTYRLGGLDETVGGRGMMVFYDQIIPGVVKDVLRKFGGGSLGEIQIDRPAFRYTVGQERVFTGEGDRSAYMVYQERMQHQSFPSYELAHAYASQRNAEESGTTWRQAGFAVTPALRQVARMGMPLFSFAAPEGVVLSPSDDLAGPALDHGPIEAVFPSELGDWFGSSRATVDGLPATRPLMVFRGAAPGDDDVGGKDPMTGQAMDVFWATSSRMNASYFEDGEIQNLYLKLENPLVLTQAGASPAKVVREIHEQVRQGKACWDGVIFEDIVDGAHPSVVYAVFPQAGSVADRIRIVGRTRYDDHTGDPIFTGVQPPGDPTKFDRGDEIRHDIDWNKRARSLGARSAISAWRADPRVRAVSDHVDVDVRESGGVIQLESLWIDPDLRGNGYASIVVRALMEAADEFSAQVELEVGPDEAEIGLVDWYRRLGFRWADGSMKRLPGTKIEQPAERHGRVQPRMEEACRA